MLKDALINSIRILPNSKSTFPSVNDFRVFVEKTMVERGGYYYFPGLMMKCPDNTLILFQYDGEIQAYGILIDKRKENSLDEKGNMYAGYYRFDVNNLRYLNNSVTADDIKKIYPDFAGFSHIKHQIPMTYVNDIVKLLENKMLYTNYMRNN